jgi:hypothetical protein
MARNIIVFITIMYSSYAVAGWRVERIGRCPIAHLEQVKIADGRNDGINRVYVASARGGIYEWTYSSGSWNYTTVYRDEGSWYMLSIGNGRNDGINRIYAGEGHVSSGDIIELTFTGGTWRKEDIALSVGNVLGLLLGDGRNDGIIRLYAGGQYMGLYEYTWTNGSWSRLVINSSIVGGTHDIDDGRNDGINRIYSPDRMGDLNEFSWTGSSFTRDSIDLPESWLCCAEVGCGRNDGVNRLYVSGYKGHLYEVSYTATGWQSLDMTPAGPNKSRYGICIGRTRSDGLYRVYVTTQGGALMEFSWNGTTYDDSVVDATSGATACLDIGVGRNDDTVRIYATNWSTGEIYEFTNTDPLVNVEEKPRDQNVKLKLSPNPFRHEVKIELQFTFHNPESPINLEIYDLAGRIVKKLINGKPEIQNNRWTIILNGNNMQPGVYLCRFKTKDKSFVKKLVKF